MSTNYTILDGTGASQTFTAYGADLLAELQSILAKLSADPATQTTLAAVLAALEGTLTVDGSGATQPISAAALPLPDGSATEATLAALLTELQAKADFSETQPVSATALPLPTGAATAANQASILAKLSADPATQTTLAAVLAALQGTLTVQPSEPALSYITTSHGASGDVTLLSAPGAGQQLAIGGFHVQNIGTTSDVVILLKWPTSKWSVFAAKNGGGAWVEFPPGREWRLGNNVPLVANLSVVTTCRFSVKYWTESV